MSRLVCGVHAVEELLKASPKEISQLWVSPPPHRPRLQALVKTARAAGIAVSQEAMKALDLRAQGSRHQGCIAVAAEFGYADFDAALGKLATAENGLVVLVDSLQDPHNLGAIVRSAFAFGASLVIITKDRCVQVTNAVERASAGTTAHLPIARVTNLRRTMEQLKGKLDFGCFRRRDHAQWRGATRLRFSEQSGAGHRRRRRGSQSRHASGARCRFDHPFARKCRELEREQCWQRSCSTKCASAVLQPKSISLGTEGSQKRRTFLTVRGGPRNSAPARGPAICWRSSAGRATVL